MQEALSSVQSGARSQLQGLSSKRMGQQAKSGFAGSGVGSGAMDASRESIMGQYQQQQSGLQRGYEDAIEGLRKGFLSDAAGALGNLQAEQGVEDFTGGTEAGTDQYHMTGGAPSNPSPMSTYTSTVDGKQWLYRVLLGDMADQTGWYQIG